MQIVAKQPLKPAAITREGWYRTRNNTSMNLWLEGHCIEKGPSLMRRPVVPYQHAKIDITFNTSRR